jgi:uncharacterized Zn finger protein (UPF0148 family)
MTRKDCPKCGHKLYPIGLPGKVIREDKTRRDKSGKHPLVQVDGRVPYLNCRYCGYKERKPLKKPNLLEELFNKKQAEAAKIREEKAAAAKKEYDERKQKIIAELEATKDQVPTPT